LSLAPLHRRRTKPRRSLTQGISLYSWFMCIKVMSKESKIAK